MEAVCRLAQSLEDLGVPIDVLGPADEYSREDSRRWNPVMPRTFVPKRPRWFNFAPGCYRALMEADVPLVHAHGLWLYPSVLNLLWARKTGRTYLISPHGMLDPWALNHSRWKKRIAGLLYENAHLRQAACLHALNESEALSFRRYGLKNPICIIPNGADLSGPPSGVAPPWSIDRGRKTLLYLGRIHPKKGLANLLSAWSELLREAPAAGRQWLLVVAGWGQSGHEDELKKQAQGLGLEDHVTFVGPLFHAEKAAALERAEAFILPSFSEGLPMAVLEAWSHGLPVLMTAACNLPEGFAAGAALQVEPEPADIARGLGELVKMSDAERRQMGQRGRRLLVERFSWSKLATDFKAVYDWMLGGAPRPDCVRVSAT